MPTNRQVKTVQQWGLFELTLNGPDKDMRSAAAEALGGFEGPRAVSALVRLLSTDDEDVYTPALACASLERITGLDFGIPNPHAPQGGEWEKWVEAVDAAEERILDWWEREGRARYARLDGPGRQ